MSEHISAKDTAKLIRGQLKTRFPGIKFSVRSDHNSINIGWTDGPAASQVETITNGYKGGGFDGMIDMAYPSSSWLLPDGSATFACTSGTTGSRGTVPAAEHEKPHPDARLVKFNATFIFCHRSHSPAFMRRVVDRVAEKYGLDLSSVDIGEHDDGTAYLIGASLIPHGDRWADMTINMERARRSCCP